MNKFCCYIFLLFALMSCKSKDYLTPYEYQGRIIHFGSGGGFTGKVSHFTLMDNGQVFEGIDKEGTVTVLKKLDKSVVEQVFDNYDKLNLKELRLDNPGNLYKFLRLNNHKITWGGKGEVPRELDIFYAILMKHVDKKVANTAKKIQVK